FPYAGGCRLCLGEDAEGAVERTPFLDVGPVEFGFALNGHYRHTIVEVLRPLSCEIPTEFLNNDVFRCRDGRVPGKQGEGLPAEKAALVVGIVAQFEQFYG